MSNQISTQANRLWQILAAPETFDSYRQAIVKTGIIFKETAILLWLTLCLGLVALEAIGAGSVSAGRSFKAWFSRLKEADTDQIATETGKALLSAGKTGLAFTITQARGQLGLSEKPRLLEPELVSAENKVSPIPAKASTSPTEPLTPSPAVEAAAKATEQE
jgi:hypothetical protein